MVPILPYNVPLYSQITDISSTTWKQKGCGVTDVAMVIDFYKPNSTTVQKVLEEGLASGAYQKNVGWIHDGLAALATRHGMVGKTVDLSMVSKDTALAEFKNELSKGPMIASIHRNFDARSPYGHLVVMTGIDDTFAYYNDPGKHDGKRKVAIGDFMKGWKRKLIVIRPAEPKTQTVALAR